MACGCQAEITPSTNEAPTKNAMLRCLDMGFSIASRVRLARCNPRGCGMMSVWVVHKQTLTRVRTMSASPLGNGHSLALAPSRPLFLAPPVEYATNAPASIERLLLLRIQAVIKRLKLGLDCLQAGKP